MTSAGAVGQRNAGAVTGVGRVPQLTGVRALAAILVLATHAAYTTGKYTHGYLGVVYSRMEIGVPIFFVLSGVPVVRPLGQGSGRRCATTVAAALRPSPGSANHAPLRGDGAGRLPDLSLP